MRIIGSLLILFSSLAIAGKLVSDAEKAKMRASALRALLEHIKNMIECYSMPIGQILIRIEPSLLRECGYCEKEAPHDLRCFAKKIEKNDGADAETLGIFEAFAKDFGKGYREDELLRCGLFLEKMRAREQKLCKEYAKKKKVILTVSICSALALIVLLI